MGHIPQRHFIAGLARDGLRKARIEIPLEAARQLDETASDDAWQSLALAGETVRLQKRFDEAGIAVTFFKGPALAVQIYGDLAIRHIRDIDALVAEASLDNAARLLHSLGYRFAKTGIPTAAAERNVWLQVYRDVALVHEDSGHTLELHWRLTRNPHLFAAGKISTHEVNLGSGNLVRTIGPEDFSAYLCAHGAVDGWFRLKWLADIGALLARGPGSAETLYRAAEKHGAAPCAAQAILLCHRLFESPVSPALLRQLQASLRALYLERAALKTLAREDAETETGKRQGRMPVLFSHFFIGSGWRYLGSEFRYWTASYTDRVMLPLPAPLHFLYPILRPPLWFRRHVIRW